MSLTYSISYPDRCISLVLRGIFLLRKFEINWFYQKGCSLIYPEKWETYKNIIPKNDFDIFDGFKVVGDFLEKTILRPNNLSYPISRTEFINSIKRI